MIKKVIKNILYYFYSIGQNENYRRIEENKVQRIKENAFVHDDLLTGPATRIINQTGSIENICIGSKCIILGELITYQHGGHIIVGDFTFIGENSRIWSAKKIVIGSRVQISHNVNIHDNSSHTYDAADRHEDHIYHYMNHKPRPNSSIPSGEIIIGDDVWIGFNSTILKGVKIGNGAIIGANTLVTKDVPANTIVIGNPQRILRNINEK